MINSISRFLSAVALFIVFSPAFLNAGNNVWTNSGPEGGNIKALIVDPTMPQTLYAGTERGGVFKSINGGNSWRPINTGMNSPYIVTALAIDPTPPQTVYAGTDSGGMFKSIDGGNTWIPINTGLGQSIYSISIDPKSPQTLYAGSGGAYKSTNGGATWRPISTGLPDYTTVRCIVIDPITPQTLYMGTDFNGAFKSTNGGSIWTAINTGLTSYASVVSLVIDPKSPQVSYAGSSMGVFKSTDSGSNWKRLTSSRIAALIMDPSAPMTLYAGTDGEGIYKSIDGGNTWILVNTGITNVGFGSVSVLAINWNSPQTLYAGTYGGIYSTRDPDDPYVQIWGGGIFKSTNGGNNWNAMNAGLTNVNVYALAIDPTMPATVYGGALAVGVVKSTNSGNSWTAAGPKTYYDASAYDATALIIDPRSPQTIYVSTDGIGVLKSSNGGKDWVSVNSGLGSKRGKALVIDPTSPQTLYLITDKGIFRSPNGGGYWSDIKFPYTFYSAALAIDPITSQTIYVGSIWGHGVFKSTDGGNSWKSVGKGWGDSNINALVVDQTDTQIVYAATDKNGVFRSADGGNSWNPVNKGLAIANVKVLAVDPLDPQTVYAGTDGGGVFKSSNRGDGWSALNAGMDYPYSIQALAIAPAGAHTLYAATYGGGIWAYSSGLASSTSITLNQGGVGRSSTEGSNQTSQAGYAAVAVKSGDIPYGTAVFSFKQGGVTVSEAGVPASPPTKSARIFIDYRSGVNAIPARDDAGAIDINTGIAVVNPGTTAANVTYTLRNAFGGALAIGHGTMGAGKHYGCFINQLKETAAPDFNLPADFQTAIQFGTLDVASDQPLSVLSLRGTTNQIKQFLITTTPVADLTKSPSSGPIYFPQFVDGGGYTTSLILMNTSTTTETGIFQIMDNRGDPLVVHQVDGISGSSFLYSISPNSIIRFQTDGAAVDGKTGWVQLKPDAGTSTPVGSGVFVYNPVNVLVTESGVPGASATTHARIYVDLSQNHNTGLAIANISEAEAAITISAYQTDGATVAGTSQGPLKLGAHGHDSKFADQFITGLPAGFTGVLDVSSAAPFAALTVRSLTNENNDFLMTTFPVADVNQAAPSPVVFPQIADGGGYATQFILLSTSGASSATINYYDNDGVPLAVGR
jgi:photosystem II stability/assembly factor-like uncharacterized protein